MTDQPIPTPPLAAERLLRWSLAPDERAAVLGDVQEEFTAIAETNRGRAVWWYWRQTAMSVLPNIARQVRNQWAEARQLLDEQDRRSRRRRLRGGLCWIAVVAVAFGWLAVARPQHWDEIVEVAAVFALPGVLAALTYWYRAMPVPSRRGQIAQVLWFTSIGVGLVHTPTFEAVREGLWVAILFLWMWPQAMWPFRRPLAVRGYSLRSPVVTYRGRAGLAFGSVIVPPTPWSMSPVIVGREDPPMPAEVAAAGVAPMMATLLRVFTSRDSVRLFAVVNAAPEGLHGTVEIRRGATGRVIATLPATVRPATPQIPFKQPHGVDPDSEPWLLPTSPMSELHVVVPLGGLAVDNYVFSLIASDGERVAVQDVEIRVWAGANW